MLEYTGILTYIRYYSEESHFIVASFKCDDDGKTISITGYMSFVDKESRYRIKGDFTVHPKYGTQFQIQSYEVIMADEKEDIIRYLSSSLFKGIGKMQAERIVDTLGTECLSMIKDDPICLTQVQGMTSKKIETITSVLYSTDNDALLLSFFTEHQLPTRFLSVIQSTYKEKTIDILKENPYSIMNDIEGIGFKSADAIGRKLGFDLHHPYRIKAALQDSVTRLCFQSGSTYTSKEMIDHMMRQYIPDIDDYEEYLESLVEEDMIILEEDRYYPKDLYQSEITIVSQFQRFFSLPQESYDESLVEETITELEKYGITYDETQRSVFYSFLKEPAFIITGGPGTGKTTIVQAIIKLYRELHPEEKIELVAPTGRAAKRLSELTGLEAQTIHRLLKWDLHHNTFAMNAHNPLDTEFIIIDEFSMVDSLLFSKLLEAGTHLKKILMIGDDQQLPSVSSGNVLKDFIHSGKVPYITLTNIYRQSDNSGIIHLAHSIRNQSLDMSLFDTYKDIHFTSCQNYEVINYTLKYVQYYMDHGYDVEDIQVLAPMYSGVAGIDNLNYALQSIVNPGAGESIKIGHKVFKEGDKILQLKNRSEEDIYNGDIGILVSVNKKDNFEYLEDTLYVDYDGNIIEYTTNQFNEITHAYCISVHKSQGNEYPVVIMPILSDYRIMMQRKLIYTGLTRAKEELVLLGSYMVFDKSLLKTGQKRHTTLIQRLQKDELSPYDFM